MIPHHIARVSTSTPFIHCHPESALFVVITSPTAVIMSPHSRHHQAPPSSSWPPHCRHHGRPTVVIMAPNCRHPERSEGPLYLYLNHPSCSPSRNPPNTRAFSTEIFSKSGIFLKPENPPSTHHVPPQNHHNFTTKNHPEKSLFPKPPSKTKENQQEIIPATTPKKMPKNTP